MNNYMGEVRNRSQTLLIVEGNHEKNELFWLIFKCFPEINIEMDIDLPFVISKKQTPGNLLYKDDFTNIILVFDYERHDTNFSERKILDMQNNFSDAADMGKLYINYPMIESYQHLRTIPDSDFAERKIPVSLQPGSKYKELVGKESKIGKIVEFPYRIDDLMNEHFGITNTEIRQKCCEDILNLSDAQCMEEKLQEVLKNAITDDRQKTLKYQLKDWINRVGYANGKQTYWQYVRNLFIEIIYHNICKANRIQKGVYEITLEQYKECFKSINLGTILDEQNSVSSTDNGFIWVLNTCVFVVADYNFSLVQREN